MRHSVIDRCRDETIESGDPVARRTAVIGIRSELREAEAILAVSGAVDEPAVPRVTALLRGLLAAGARYVVVDLSEVTTCSAGLGPILDGERAALSTVGGWLTVLGTPAVAGGWAEPSLADLFEAYRRARTAARGTATGRAG